MPLPTYDELPEMDGARCAWGVWGPDDLLGCLNNLSAERVVAAGAEVQRGAVFQLNLALGEPDPPLFERSRLRHDVVLRSDVFKDDLLHNWNTQASTQWDGFRHVRFPGRGWFNGLPDDLHGIHHWARRGIVGRAVLIDVARWRAANDQPLRPDASEPIELDDLLGCLRSQASPVTEGDILLVRTGWLSWYRTLGRAERAALAAPGALRNTGLRPSHEIAGWLWNSHVAAIAADNPALEVWPLGSLDDRHDDDGRDAYLRATSHLHLRLLPMLGIPIGELFDLDVLAADCAVDGRYTVFFTSMPLLLESGVGSPANAVAVK